MTTRKKAAKQAAPPSDVLQHGTPKDVPHAPDQKTKARKWTRKEAESHVQSLGLRCQGPRDPERMAQWQGLMAQGKTAEARTVNTRVGCGYDFGQTVLSEPFDGAEHETPCPKCGTLTSWRSPVFDGLSETKQGKR